jgi:hypothetical protein
MRKILKLMFSKPSKFKFTCYITRVQLCNCRKTTVGPRFAFRMVCLIIRFKQHAFKPAIYCREKLQHIEQVKNQQISIPAYIDFFPVKSDKYHSIT